MPESIRDTYNRWVNNISGDLLEELISVKDDESAINERFYRRLKFGTGGLRGVIGVGTNRMNVHTVGLASQALADWLNCGNSAVSGKSVAIAYDSRNKSEEFSKTTACVLAANGIRVYLFSCLTPTPMLSYAVRELGCSAGVVITASHNPAKYNGYKCYGADGCQLTDKSAGEVETYSDRLDIFDDVKSGDFDELLEQDIIRYIDERLTKKYLNRVLACAAEPQAARKAGLRVVYTPLCGTGNKPVREILRRIGVDVRVVTEQEQPDGTFPRCPRPNPENREAFDAALELAEELIKKNEAADLLLATDPDCDRVGIAVRDTADGGKYTLMSGNEVGALMLNYLLSRRKENGTLPEKPRAVKTIVTTALAERICKEYDCELITCLTGFKYIGEIIGELEKNGEEESFILGFEESYGYLGGTYARDKDAVYASMIICEMAAYYKSLGKTLYDVMRELYERYGYYINSQISTEFEGQAGAERISEIMTKLREDKPNIIENIKVVEVFDYLGAAAESANLPKSNIIEFICADSSVLTVRPSGTEPKIKFYLTAAGATPELSRQRIDELSRFIQAIVN
ncbi:MAG: phospho-sugar mutase [Oscillospiraceae bacterium]|nr:phospho-sugar mutase [Oscillospiraceae bacterium]